MKQDDFEHALYSSQVSAWRLERDVAQCGAWGSASGCVPGCQPSKVHNKAEISYFFPSEVARNDLEVYHLQSISS